MKVKSQLVYQVQPRDTVEVHLGDGRVFCGQRNLPVLNFLQCLPEWDKPPITAAIINGELKELSTLIDMDARVQPVTMEDVDGVRIYRRSLILLLEAAFEELFPERSLTVDHSVASGGFYCSILEGQSLNSDDLDRLLQRMQELVYEDIPIVKSFVSLEDAIDIFKSKGHHEKVLLLKYRQKEHLVMYSIKDHKDYHHGYMVPSTGFLRWFALSLLGDGFVLQFPRRSSIRKLNPVPEAYTLLKTFRQYGGWLTRLGIDNVGALNSAIQENRIREVVLMSEALHEQKIADIASEILERKDTARVVLIAGPSSSGKTTFSKRLAVQMLAHGLEPFALELDNYFVDREKTPKDEKGEYDFETIEAVNTNLLTDQIRRLIAGEEVQLPVFNFKTGKSEWGEHIRLGKDQIIIMEGIHGLNPRLLPDIPTEKAYKIYASCLTQLNLDRYNRISTTDTRLIRRIVRDSRERGYSALQTIKRWESVRQGEQKHIYPYQEYAQDMFNSALVYELSVLKPFAEPLLRQVPPGSREYVEAKRLLAFLEWFLPLDTDLVPDNSISREFIGGSILKDFKPWKTVEDS